MHKFLLLIIMTFLPVSILAQNTQNALQVRLSVTERSGIDRIDEPVTFGVPLPNGRIDRIDDLLLLDEGGQPVPASFGIAQHGLEGSVQWLHVHSLLTVPASQKRRLTLLQDSKRRDAQKLGSSVLRVEEKENRVTVIAGPVKLELSARTPGIVESAFYSPSGRFGLDTEVMTAMDAGTGIIVGGRSYDAVRAGTGRMEVLEQSAMRVVVLASGEFADRSDSESKPSLSFEARVIAYAGSPRVTVDYTIINRTGETASDKIDLEDLSLAFRLPFKRPSVTIGAFNSPIEELLESEASIFQDSADHYSIRMNGQTVGEGPGKSSRTVETGWVDVGDDSRGVAVGVRDFWQTWPKKIDCLADQGGRSLLRLSLYPRESGRAQELYIGQARSHRITLRFHEGDVNKRRLVREMTSLNRPLRVVCDAEWYCRVGRPYGPIAPSKSDFRAFTEVARHYDRIVDDSMSLILTQLHEGRTSRGVTRDSYGWMNWGDVFFRTARSTRGPQFDDPEKNLSWSGNYYDYGFAMLLEFMRSGDPRYLEMGLRAGAYTADVFIVHHHPDPTLVGACHYCPPRYHAAIDNGEPYISRENNHAKVASVLARWQWLGDWWARKVALEAFNNALTLKGADMKGWEQCRGNGHRLRILWLAYHFTGERKYREKAKQLIDLGVEFVQKNPEFDPQLRESQRFMVGIALEGLILHYWDTQDPAILEAVKTVADHAYKVNGLNRYTVNMAMAFGFLWKETGDRDYLRALSELIMKTKPTDQAKVFGQSFRSTPWALGYLEEAAAEGVPAVK